MFMYHQNRIYSIRDCSKDEWSKFLYTDYYFYNLNKILPLTHRTTHLRFENNNFESSILSSSEKINLNLSSHLNF